ncbi:hypothetical protein Tco_1235744 [Tanacetum coccineum]
MEFSTLERTKEESLEIISSYENNSTTSKIPHHLRKFSGKEAAHIQGEKQMEVDSPPFNANRTKMELDVNFLE